MGQVHGPPAGTNNGALCTSDDPGPSFIRRLTRREYNNTVRDLLGDISNAAATFPVEEHRLGFNNNAEALTVSPVLAEQYILTAEKIAAGAVANNLGSLVSCDPVAQGVDACGQQFIESFGKRAYRSPLNDDDRAVLTAVFNAGKATDFATGVRLVIETALQAPRFLYRVEMGRAAQGGQTIVGLDGWEQASRLSYLLWGSMPDDALFAAAEADRLSTPDEIAAEVERMLQDPKARATTADFHAQWLRLAELDVVEKETAVYPGFTRSLGGLMREEAEAFIDHVVWQGEGTVAALLTAPFTFANGTLAQYYGLSGVSGSELVRVDLDPGTRGGLLTQGAFLSLSAKANQTSPVLRGKFVREELFCEELLPPPPDAEIRAPDLDPNLTTRERFAQHSADPGCANCHQLMDPIGLGFETFDGAGKYRAEENGKTVDATGAILGTDVAGTFNGPIELQSRLAGSAQVRSCVATKWFRYAYGRGETEADTCSMGSVQKTFADSGGYVPDLLKALTRTKAFTRRRVTPAVGVGS
jgi:hypothetical protein